MNIGCLENEWFFTTDDYKELIVNQLHISYAITLNIFKNIEHFLPPSHMHNKLIILTTSMLSIHCTMIRD